MRRVKAIIWKQTEEAERLGRLAFSCQQGRPELSSYSSIAETIGRHNVYIQGADPNGYHITTRITAVSHATSRAIGERVMWQEIRTNSCRSRRELLGGST